MHGTIYRRSPTLPVLLGLEWWIVLSAHPILMRPRVVQCKRVMASRSVNKVILIGNLGKDAETKFTPSGVSVTRFSVATSRRWKDQASGEWKEETDWTNVSLWRSEALGEYLKRGKQVYVEGRLQTRSYEDKDGQKKYSTEVVADNVILLGGRGEGGGEEGGYSGGYSAGGGQSRSGMVSAPRGGGRGSSPASDPGGFDPGITDDDVPF